MLEIVQSIVENWLAIWSSASFAEFQAMYHRYVVGTVFLCMPVYLLVGGAELFGFKTKPGRKLLRYTAGVNIALALFPVVFPVAAVIFVARQGWQWYKRRQVNTHSPRRPRNGANSP